MLIELLLSLEKFSGSTVSSIIIVDNGSTDSSISLLEHLVIEKPKIEIIRNSENKGFATACNQGAALAKDDVILFLNPDARVCENSISEPMSVLALPANASVGIIGIRLVDDSGQTTRSCSRFPSSSMYIAQSMGLTRVGPLKHWNPHMTDWAHDSVAQIDHVIGAFYMIRRSLFEQLEGFDERFFVYLEDLDLSLRARQAGWRSIYLATASAYHAGGGTSRQVKARRLFYSLRSKLLYGFKHFSGAGAWGLAAVVVLVEPFSRLIFAIARGRPGEVSRIFHAYFLLLSDLPTIARRARTR